MPQRVVHGWGCVDGVVFLVVLLYAVIYVSLLLVAARFVLNRRRL